MANLEPGDAIAIVALIVAVAGSVIADRRAKARTDAEHRLQANLRVIEDTQRYTMTMLDYVSTLALQGRDQAGLPPNPGDFPKLQLGLLDRATFAHYSDLVLHEARRATPTGAGWSPRDQRRFLLVASEVRQALAAQEALVRAGKPPVQVPPDDQHADMLAQLASYGVMAEDA